jgi:hypothetical protein
MYMGGVHICAWGENGKRLQETRLLASRDDTKIALRSSVDTRHWAQVAATGAADKK